MTNILISNDDGVYASGILAAKHAVEDLGDVTIVAPANQQSGIGRALTLFEPLRINSLTLNDGTPAYSVSGTPTDAITLGIFEVLDEKPDLVISGINVGHNTGKGELTTSGTIGAAMEAAALGIPSIAVSQEVSNSEMKFERHVELDYSVTEKILYEISEKIIKKGLPNGADLLNLNVPAKPSTEEILITRLGERMYNPTIDVRLDPRGKPYYWINGLPYKGELEGTDGYGLKVLNQPTLTPLKIDCTGNLDSLSDW
jgi:5'-nucleotidase